MADILIISLRIAPAEEAAFTEFYHHQYIPKLLEIVPEIITARRYEEYGVAGSLKWFSKRLITLYELAPNVSLEQITSALSRPGREDEIATWQHWQNTALQNLSRVAYQQTYCHPRCPGDGIFGNRPFFQVSVEVKPESETVFGAWYEENYLPKIMADVPTWAACRRYTSVDREPVIRHTIYETHSLADLETSFASMRSPYRYGSNADWDQWVGPVITYQDAASYRPIFRRPG
jgi:hypothetical protein